MKKIFPEGLLSPATEPFELRQVSNTKGLEDLGKYVHLKSMLRVLDTIMAIIGSSSIIIQYFINEYMYYSKPMFEITDLTNKLCIINMILICVLGNLYLVTFLFFRYFILSKILLHQKEFSHVHHGETLILPYFFLEVLICSVFLPPYVDITFKGSMLDGSYVYNLSQIVMTVILLRSYLIIRLYEHYSTWTNSKAQNICHRYSVVVDFLFALKSDLKVKPFLAIGIIMAFLIVGLGVAVMMAEMTFKTNSQLEMDQITNNEWLIIITMATVGYGDFYPSSYQGRVFCILGCIFGMILVSAMIVSLNTASEFTTEQKEAYRIIKSEMKVEKLKNAAMNIIKNAFKVKRSDKLLKKLKNMLMLKKSVYEFKRISKNHNEIKVSTSEILYEIQKDVEIKFDSIKSNVLHIHDLNQRCSKLSQSMDKSEKMLDIILEQQELISEYIDEKYITWSHNY